MAPRRPKPRQLPAAPRARWALAPWQRPHGTPRGKKGYDRAAAKRQSGRNHEEQGGSDSGAPPRCGTMKGRPH